MTTSLLPENSPLDAGYRFGLALPRNRRSIPVLPFSSAVRRFRTLTRYDLRRATFCQSDGVGQLLPGACKREFWLIFALLQAACGLSTRRNNSRRKIDKIIGAI